MRQRSFIAIAVVLAVLVLGAVAVYAYDSSRKDTIAKGVTAGGVDLSGMKPKQAQAKLDRELAAPLQKAVYVKFAHRRYKLTPEKAQVRVDTAGMVQEAVAASRKGNILSRTTRELTGGDADKNISPRGGLSRQAGAEVTKEPPKKN